MCNDSQGVNHNIFLVIPNKTFPPKIPNKSVNSLLSKTCIGLVVMKYERKIGMSNHHMIPLLSSIAAHSHVQHCPIYNPHLTWPCTKSCASHPPCCQNMAINNAPKRCAAKPPEDHAMSAQPAKHVATLVRTLKKKYHLFPIKQESRRNGQNLNATRNNSEAKQ